MLIRLLPVILLFVFVQPDGNAQPFAFASKAVRDSVANSLKQKIDATVAKPVNEHTLNDWKGACWAMELMLYRPSGLRKRISATLKHLHQQPVSFQQSFLEMIITLYPGKFKKPLTGTWTRLGSNKVKAMALEQLALAKHFPDLKADTAFAGSVYGSFYVRRWKGAGSVFPEKSEFLDQDFLKGQTVLVSFQTRNRDKPGCLMIRTAGHEWMKDERGTPYCFTQLARSITNLPWYITNGNTPQGLYRITGTDISTNNWIGPTPNLQLVMPLEEAPHTFFTDTVQSHAQYKKLLGPLVKFAGLYESYYAGKAGRSEIIAHGTTIPEWFYKGKTYYPSTPSLGCLCSPETWNESGMLATSAQREWMKLVSQLENQPVYLVVVEVGE
jgi:hypothetical protein